MSRGEERVDSVPLMKMMHLMVNRRQVPVKKTSSVNETLNDGLVTFALDRQELDIYKPQQIHKPPPRRSYLYPEPDSLPSPKNVGEEAVRRADFERALRKAVNSADGDGDDRSSLGCNRRHRRSASLPDAKQLHNIRLGPTLTPSLSSKETQNIAAIPEKLTADDSTGKFAYISLDGRLINAELATSVTSIGGRLGDEEAQAWEDFAPMQRVLIVAVSAAAAAAAKHRNRKEIDRLLKTVESREDELISLRKELNELCKQSNTNVSHPEPFQILEALAVRGSPPKTPAQGNPTVLRRSFDGDNIKVNLNLQEAWSSTKPRVESELRGQGEYDEPRVSRDSPVNKDVVLVESSPCRSDSFSCCSFPAAEEARPKEEAKWYVNPMVETFQDFYDISTPERSNSMFSVCNPAVEGSFEWTVLSSSFGSRETDPSTGLPPLVDSPLTTPTQTTVSSSSYQTRSLVVDDGVVHKEHVAMRALCAAIVLDLRRCMLSVLDKEASMVMAALDTSARDAKSQLASMHLAVASCWNASLPKALAALNLSPSEFDSYLRHEAQGTSTWNDISTIEEGIVAWRQYLEKNHVPFKGAESKSPNKLNFSERTVSLRGADEWSIPLAYPRYSEQNEDGNFRVQSGDLAYPRNSSEDLAEQLLGELDKAAAKVAVMESQMKKLEQDVAGRNDKNICKVSGCTERDLADQVKGCKDVAELVKQLQSKEVEVADLKKGQQTLLEFKKKETEELKEDFKRRVAELDKLLAAAETTKTASADRLAMLEELCREKDSALSYLKQDIQALESKVQKSRVYQSPAVPRDRRYSSSSTPSSSSGYGTSQKQRFSEKYAPSAPCSDPILEHIGRFKKDVPSNKGHLRNLPYINTQRHEELTDDGRSEHGYDQETSHDYSSPPGSTIGDDCSVNSLAFSEIEVESRYGSEYCSSGDDSRYRGSKDRLSGTKGSSYNRTLQKQKSVSSDLRRAVTSTASSVRGLTRTQSNKNFTSATSGSKTATGEKYSIKPLHRTLSGEIKKVIKDPNSPRTSNLKGLGSVAANHRRSSSLDMNFKSNICATLETSGLSGGLPDSGSPNSQENSAIKRKRWV